MASDSLLIPHQEEQPDTLLESFSQHWKLGHDAKEFLRQLPPDVRERVIERFDPMSGTQDINRKLIGFAKSVAADRGIKGPSAPYQSSLGMGRGPPAQPQAIASPAPKDEEGFLKHWGLDTIPAARDFLSTLQEDVRIEVIRCFAPKLGTRDPLKLFIGFANSVSRKFESGGILGPPPVNVPPPPPPPPRRPAGAQAAPSGPPYADKIEEFAAWWKLDPGSQALLRGLPEEIRTTVMKDFNPRGPYQDISGKFCGFARSVASQMQAKGENEGRGVKRSAPWGPESR